MERFQIYMNLEKRELVWLIEYCILDKAYNSVFHFFQNRSIKTACQESIQISHNIY